MTGARYLVLSGLGLSLVNAGVKLVPRLPPYELLFFRAIISLLITYPLLLHLGKSPWGNNKPMLALRGLLGTFGLLLYFYTLQSMPFASAVTIQYLHPVLTAVVAAYFLGEHPKPTQWALFAASFVGVILVRGFDPRVSGVDVAIGLISAALTALSFTVIRALRSEDHPLVVMLYLPLVSLFALGPYTLLHWTSPRGVEWMIVAGIGGLTQLSQYFLTKAYHLDTAANISNLNYLVIAYALVIGMIFFGEQLEPLALIGMVIIVGSAMLSGKVRN